MNMADNIHLEGLRSTLKHDEPMAKHVSWRAGGRARRYYAPADFDDLAAFLPRLPADEPILFVGLGSNLLVRDGGWPGTVIHMHAAERRPQITGEQIYAEAGVASPKIARFAALHDLTGAEFLAGIPGTVGGALAMNAGCYGSETWEIVDRVLTIGRDGRIQERDRSAFEIGYRHCSSPREEWFLAAWFKLRRGSGEAARQRIKELLARRIATQPLTLPNAGSVFRNPPGEHAARLIESCGLKGFGRGGARVSEKHANFIVNPKGVASASDIEWLIVEVRRMVLEKTGIALVPEVRIVGEAA